jgi:hypothetical protein
VKVFWSEFRRAFPPGFVLGAFLGIVLIVAVAR